MHVREIIETCDLHTAGEPVRVITSGLPPILGETVLAKRDYLLAHLDHYRQRLMREPWGHQDMYGCLLVEPDREDSQYGLIFMHNQGYSTACGHATLAVAKMLAETGRVIDDASLDVVIRLDAPSGQLIAHVLRSHGEVDDVWFENVPSYAVVINHEIVVRGQRLRVDVGFGGAYYAVIDSRQLGIPVKVDQIDAFVEWAHDVVQVIRSTSWVTHPLEPRLSGLYGVIFTEAAHHTQHHSRNVTIFADGQVDRSPCGSGLSARLALLCAKNLVTDGEPLTVESVIDTTFMGEVLGDGPDIGPYHTVRTAIHGKAFITGFRRFYGNPEDTVEPFLIR